MFRGSIRSRAILLCALCCFFSLAPMQSVRAQVSCTDTCTDCWANETDSLALVAIYNATDGANWIPRENTNQSTACWLNGEVSTWFGISGIQGQQNFRISKLSLFSIGMKGELPEQMGDMTELVWLQVNHNELTGEIPAFLNKLKMLEWLFLNNNQFSGTIPTWLGTLKSLTLLFLSFNQLTGPIPVELGTLPDLDRLILNENQLSGTIPATLGSLSKLTDLELSDNQLTGAIPGELGGLGNLIFLAFDNNQLNGAVPEQFRNLGDLTEMHLERNELEDLPDLTGGLSSLTDFFISQNKLTFDDLEPNASFTGIDFSYGGQAKVETMRQDEDDGSVVLTVDVGGVQTTFQWFRDGVVIPDATNSTYTLPFADGSTYHNVAENVLLPQLQLLSQELLVDLEVCPTGKASVVTCPLLVNVSGDAGFDQDNPIPDNNVCDVNPDEEGVQCTLRAALQVAEKLASGKRSKQATTQIIFSLPGNPPVLQIQSALPKITSQVEIDGSTHPAGFVVLDGGQAGNNVDGLIIEASGSTVRGLNIQNFEGVGIFIRGQNNTVDACVIVDNKNEGIVIAARSNSNTISDNVLSGNKTGIVIFGADDNKILRNKIGTDAAATAERGNVKEGIRIEAGKRTTVRDNIVIFNKIGVSVQPILFNGLPVDRSTDTVVEGNTILGNSDFGFFLNGDETEVLNNVISGNGQGLYVSEGAKNMFTRNKIGTDSDGLASVPNLKDGLTLISCSDCTVNLNVISGNVGIGVMVVGGNDIKILANKIGTDITGTMPLESRGLGLLVENTIELIVSNNTISANDLGGLELIKVQKAFVLANVIGTDESRAKNLGNGLQGIIIEESQKIGIEGNSIAHNELDGIRLVRSQASAWKNTIWDNTIGINIVGGDTWVQNNTIGPNQRNIVASDVDEFFILNTNKIIDGQSSGTGIHLTRSHALIHGNLITGDAGDGITLEQGSTGIFSKNNIFSNQGFGLNNLSPVVITDARDNWWGHSSGPAGAGPGTGDLVSPGVDYTDWRSEAIAVVASSQAEPILVPIEEADTVSVFLRNWQFPTDILDVSINEEKSWLVGPTSYSIELEEDVGAEALLPISVPAGLPEGTRNTVEFIARSQANPLQADTTVFTLVAQIAVPSDFLVSPDSVATAPGSTVVFAAFAFDQFGRSVSISPVWSASGGSIDVGGVYIADGGEGTFRITAEDPVSGLTAEAVVYVDVSVGTKAEAEVPSGFALVQNYPNPFNPFTTIEYTLSAPNHTSLVVYDLLGRRVKTLVDESQRTGLHRVQFDASALSSGIYFYRLVSGDFAKTHRMVLLR